MKRLLMGGCLSLCLAAGPAYAVTVSGGPGDEIVMRFYQSFTQVWAPIIALVALLGFLGALFSGHRIGGKAIALILTLVFLGGGLPYLSQWSGGGLAAGATLADHRAGPAPQGAAPCE